MAVTRDDIQDPTGQRSNMPGRGFLRGFGHGAAYYNNTTTTINGIKGNPINGEVGWAKSALFQNDVAPTSGNFLWINTGTNTSATWTNLDFAVANGVIGVASGYKLARGSTALDGSNPTPVVTGLATVVGATVTLEGSSAPGVGTSVLTQAQTNWGTGTLQVYAWKVTATGDCTLIASTGTETFDWIAVGT